MAAKTTGECECGNPRPLNAKQCAACAEIEQRRAVEGKGRRPGRVA